MRISVQLNKGPYMSEDVALNESYSIFRYKQLKGSDSSQLGQIEEESSHMQQPPVEKPLGLQTPGARPLSKVPGNPLTMDTKGEGLLLPAEGTPEMDQRRPQAGSPGQPAATRAEPE